MLASLMKIPKRATVEVRDNIHTLIFTCDGCRHEMRSGFHCTECPDYDLCSACYEKNGHQHRMERFSTSHDAPGQRAGTSSIQKELQAASVISPVCSQRGQPNTEQEMITIPQPNGTMVRQEIKIKIDRENKMHVIGLLPRQQLYRYNNGELKIHWDYAALQRAHELHYLQLPAVIIPCRIPSLSDGRDTGHHNKARSPEKNQRHLYRDKSKIQPSERKEHLKKKKVTIQTRQNLPPNQQPQLNENESESKCPHERLNVHSPAPPPSYNTAQWGGMYIL